MKNLVYMVMVALAFATITPQNATAKKRVPKKEIALQLYSLRTEFGKDFANYADILKEVSSMGYTAVEAANYNDGLFYGRTPEQFKADLEANNLRPLSSHVGRQLTEEELASHDFTQALAWWEKCIADHKAAGMPYIVTPWMSVPSTLKDLTTYCDYLNAIGELCNQNNIRYGYHNHNHEFQKVEGEVMYDYMLQHTDPSKVFFQMDVYWVMMGQASPVEYFQRYPGRFLLLHIKDQKEIGESGMVGFDAIFRNVKTAGSKGIIVEVERYNFAPAVSVEKSIKYLLNAPFVPAKY